MYLQKTDTWKIKFSISQNFIGQEKYGSKNICVYETNDC